MLSLSSLPYKNMLPIQLLLYMIHRLDKINCHMVKLEKKDNIKQQLNSIINPFPYLEAKFGRKKLFESFVQSFLY